MCCSLHLLPAKQLAVAQESLLQLLLPLSFLYSRRPASTQKALEDPQSCSHWWHSNIAHRKRTDQILCGMQTQCGRALAVPLFVVLAQNRSLHIVGQDRGVGQVDPTLRPEDRIRVVSDRFDQANRLLVQASSAQPAQLTCFWNCHLVYSIMSSVAHACKTVMTSNAHLASGLTSGLWPQVHLTSGLNCMISSESGWAWRGMQPSLPDIA